MSLLPIRDDHGGFEGAEQDLQLPQPRVRQGQLSTLRRAVAHPDEVRRDGKRRGGAQEDLHRKQDGRGHDQALLQLPEAIHQAGKFWNRLYLAFKRSGHNIRAGF